MRTRPGYLVVWAALLGAVIVHPSMARADEVGVLAGINWSNLKFDIEDVPGNLEWNSRPGFTGGLFYRKDLSANLGVEVDTLFTQRGARLKAFGETASMRINYFNVELPVMYQAIAAARRTLRVYVGPYIGFKLKTTFNVSGEDVPIEDDDDDVRSPDAGLIVGGEIGFGPGAAGVRYGRGLVNLAQDSSDGTTVNNSVLLVYGKYRFGR